MAFTNRTKISEYDATAANNINLGTAASPAARLGEYGVDADAEAMRPSDTNGALRELMAHLKAMDAGTSVLTSPKAGQFLLEAISASITATAVDVFVYDTSKDSDGGAWRKRCQHTSWYNETLNTATRGSRREFPAVAVIVAEASKVTIYDADDPALPMWMVFNAAVYNICPLNASVISLSAKNGIVAMAGDASSASYAYAGVRLVNFVTDSARKHTATDSHSGPYRGTIAQRNDGLFDSVGSEQKITNDIVNDVALTVLPDAPTDPATGLPVPTIAVATDGGVSVIKDDGTVVDLTYLVAGDVISKRVVFLADGGIAWASRSTNRYIQVLDSIPASDYTSAPDRLYVEGDVFGTIGGNDLALLNINAANNLVDGACAGDDGLTHLHEDSTTPANGMVAYTTSTYNTGWMNGDIKGAFLSDTDDTDLVGGTDADRSVNNNPLTVNGTVTRSAVATGADLVAYSGFSSSNYLEQPYNADLDFGTGDFCVMGWHKSTGSNANADIFARGTLAPATDDRIIRLTRWSLGRYAFGVQRFGIGADGVEYEAGNITHWAHIVCIRRSGTLELWLDGRLVAFGPSATDASQLGAVLRLGQYTYSLEGSAALWRISATAPNADQIAKIYEDEKFLFQDSAACTLYGASDAVTALAHDSGTGLLHVGTSAGRSVFQGLRRVDNTTTAVGAAISASGALVVEE